MLKHDEAGADVNCTNCYGYTPLLEACHRGFISIAAILVSRGAKVDYIPPEELSSASPFVSSPAQHALGEAARCGFSKIAKVLPFLLITKQSRNSDGLELIDVIRISLIVVRIKT